MADAVTTQVLYESASDYIVKFTNVSDATGENDVNKIDVSALSPGCAEVDILKIIFATDGMAVRIEFDATADTPAFLVPSNQNGMIDFTKSPPGGLRNSGGAGKTGDVFFTTFGHSAGDSYFRPGSFMPDEYLAILKRESGTADIDSFA
jgi:hypothetical protein